MYLRLECCQLGRQGRVCHCPDPEPSAQGVAQTGLTEPIQEGGLGFSFTHNYHESLSLDQQHEGIYEVVKQIQASSNCLSITFAPTQKEDYIYLLFSFIIAKKGVFTRGPIDSIKSELIKVLKLRKQ